MSEQKFKPIDIDSVDEGEYVTGTCLFLDGTVSMTKSSQKYYSGKISTKKGVLAVICFKSELAVDLPEAHGKVCMVRGKRGSYQGTKQLQLEDVQLCDDDPLNYIKNSGITFNDVIGELQDIDKDYLSIFTKIMNEAVQGIFDMTPAAVFHHDAQIGGLANHKYKGLRLMKVIKDIYELNEKEYSLVKLAFALHDIGKMVCMTENLEYTLQGYRLGHQYWGLLFIEKHKEYIREKIGQVCYETLLSCVAYHHGEFEGKNPPTYYGEIVHMVDALDAKITAKKELKDEHISELPYTTKLNGEYVIFDNIG